jgi:predicted transcriptional regulator
MTLKLNPENDGLSKVFFDYQEKAMKYLWMKGKVGANSREVWKNVNKSFNGLKTISRASIINFLNDMVDEGVLDYISKTGKGGYQRVYSPKMDEKGFNTYLVNMVITSLMDDFPDETMEILKKHVG